MLEINSGKIRLNPLETNVDKLGPQSYFLPHTIFISHEGHVISLPNNTQKYIGAILMLKLIGKMCMIHLLKKFIILEIR